MSTAGISARYTKHQNSLPSLVAWADVSMLSFCPSIETSMYHAIEGLLRVGSLFSNIVQSIIRLKASRFKATDIIFKTDFFVGTKFELYKAELSIDFASSP